MTYNHPSAKIVTADHIRHSMYVCVYTYIIACTKYFIRQCGRRLDCRIAGPITFRGQLDWINTRFYGEGQNGVRFSTGIAVHF